MKTSPETIFVVCVNNGDYPASLEVRKIYQAIVDEKAGQLGMIRVIDESGEDYLFPSHCFVEITIPQELKEKAFAQTA